MNNKKIPNETSNKEKGGKSALVICGIIICVLIAVILVLVLRPREEAEKEKRNVVVTKDNVKEVVQEMEEELTSSGPLYYTATMNSTWHFADGTSASSNAHVANSEDNATDVYFDVIRTDTNETIYESPILPRGSHLEEITLGTDLDAGEYDCVLIYYLIDEEQEVLSTVRFALTIVVEG